MSEHDVRTAQDEGPPEEEFTPIGTMVLTVVYIIIFASAWGLVYFLELLPRR